MHIASIGACLSQNPILWNGIVGKRNAHAQLRSLAIWSKLPFGISDSDIDLEVNFLAKTLRIAFDLVQIPVDIDDTCTDEHKIQQMQLFPNMIARDHEDRPVTTVCETDMLTWL